MSFSNEGRSKRTNFWSHRRSCFSLSFLTRSKEEALKKKKKNDVFGRPGTDKDGPYYPVISQQWSVVKADHSLFFWLASLLFGHHFPFYWRVFLIVFVSIIIFTRHDVRPCSAGIIFFFFFWRPSAISLTSIEWQFSFVSLTAGFMQF